MSSRGVVNSAFTCLDSASLPVEGMERRYSDTLATRNRATLPLTSVPSLLFPDSELTPIVFPVVPPSAGLARRLEASLRTSRTTWVGYPVSPITAHAQSLVSIRADSVFILDLNYSPRAAWTDYQHPEDHVVCLSAPLTSRHPLIWNSAS